MLQVSERSSSADDDLNHEIKRGMIERFRNGDARRGE
jgi:hypothetical protein